MKKQIEIEFRALLTKDKYDNLKDFLNTNSKNLGEDNKDVYFFILPDKLVKIVNNISKKSAKLVIKLNKIGKSDDFEETEVSIRTEDVNNAVEILTLLNFTDNIMHFYQKRHNYLYKGVEIALKYSDIWGYHAELEIVIDDKSKKSKAESKIKKIANELNIKLMSNKELIKFTKRAEQNYKNNNKNEKGIN